MSVTGPTDGPPARVGIATADLFTGMAAAQACLAALIAADRDGFGQHIDMALHDCQLAMLANVASAYLISGEEAGRFGNGHPTIVPYESFATTDGAVVIAVGNDRQFAALAILLDCPELAHDTQFATNAERIVNRITLLEMLRPIIATRATGGWLQDLADAGIPAGAIKPVSKALDGENAAGRGMIATVAHPLAGPLRIMASPLKLRGTPVVRPTAPPLLGEHTDVLRSKLGMVGAAILALRANRIVA